MNSCPDPCRIPSCLQSGSATLADNIVIRGISKPSLEEGLGSSVPVASSAAVGRHNSSPSASLEDARAFLAKPWLQLLSAVSEEPAAGAAVPCCSASARATRFRFPFCPRRDELPSWPTASAVLLSSERRGLSGVNPE